MRLGQKLIARLTQLRDEVRSGKPQRQSVVRRMVVRGRTVFVRESFTASIK